MRVLRSDHYSADHRGFLSGYQKWPLLMKRLAMAVGWIVLMGAMVWFIYQIIVFLMPLPLYE